MLTGAGLWGGAIGGSLGAAAANSAGVYPSAPTIPWSNSSDHSSASSRSSASSGATPQTAAPVSGEQPDAPPRPESWPTAGHADQLPQTGEMPYVPPKSAGGKPQNLGGGQGFKDADGNLWQWAKAQHGGPHWDVQLKGGGYTNVYPDGNVR